MGHKQVISDVADAVIEAENWYVFDIIDGLAGTMGDVGYQLRKELEEGDFRFENEEIWKKLGMTLSRKEMLEIKISYWLVINDVIDPRHTNHPDKVEKMVNDYPNIHHIHNAKAANGAGAAAYAWADPFICFYKTSEEYLERRVEKNISQLLEEYANTRFERTLKNYTRFREDELRVGDNSYFIKTFFHELVHHHYQKKYMPKNLPEDYTTVTEIFAWNITRHWLDEGLVISKPADSYKNPEIIEWGADRMEEMKNLRDDLPDDSYEWLFQLQDKIFEKGKKHSETGKFPQKCLDIFVIEMLPNNERKTVYGIIKLTGNEFNSAFQDLENYLSAIHEQATQDNDRGVKMRRILNQLDTLAMLIHDAETGEEELFSPDNFRKRILNDVTQKAIKNRLSAQEIIQLVDKHVKTEAEELLQIVDELRTLHEEITRLEGTDKNSEGVRNLKKVIMEMQEVERKLELIKDL